MKTKHSQIWVEKIDKGNFRAFLALRHGSHEGVISSHDPSKMHRTSREALAALKKEIKEEIEWLKDQYEEIT